MSRYVVTQDGKKLPIDDSAINEDDHFPMRRNVHIIDDNHKLKKCWILQLSNELRPDRKDTYELELIKELKYNHYPSEEEIIWAMSEYGIWGVAVLVEGYEFDYSY